MYNVKSTMYFRKKRKEKSVKSPRSARTKLKLFFISLLFVLTQKVTKKSRLDLFAKKLRFLLRKSQKLGRTERAIV